jgi:hypothetical protein
VVGREGKKEKEKEEEKGEGKNQQPVHTDPGK